jgi:YVTN family beta-propeller protein
MRRIGFIVFVATVVTGVVMAPAGMAFPLRTAGPSPVLPSVPVGGNPTSDVVDQATNTVYVANSNDGTVSVIDGSACNAGDLGGCGQPVATFPAPGALSVAVDDPTHTLYVADSDDGTVLVVDTSTCDGVDQSGCGAAQASVAVGSGPGIVAVDEASDTVYVGNGNENTVSVIDGSTCNASTTSGCGQTPATVTVGSSPNGIAVDPADHSVYVGNFNDGTASVFDGTTCDGTDHSGCNETPSTIPDLPDAGQPVVDDVTHTVYIPATGDALGWEAMIDTSTCNGTVSSGCAGPHPTTQVGSLPSGAALDPANRTLYVANEEDSSAVAIGVDHCNVGDTSGCRPVPPELLGGFNPIWLDVDAATGTVYMPSQDTNSVSVLNANTCNGTHTSGCTRVMPVTAVDSGPQGIAYDHPTHTVYSVNQGANTVSVVDARRCNAVDRAGCGQAWPEIAVGGFPKDVVVDDADHTAYVANGDDGTLSLVDTSTCNAEDASGCGQTPATVTVGAFPIAQRLDTATHTLYVSNRDDGTVSVIDTSTCNAQDTYGCAGPQPTISVGSSPRGMAIDPKTDTVYVANIDDGTASVIDGATCNATKTTGCGQTPPTVTIGANPRLMDFDAATRTIYVANADDGTVSVIDAATCNSRTTTGCGVTAPTFATGGFPFGVFVDQATQQVYVTSIDDSTLGVVNANTCRAGRMTNCKVFLFRLRTGGWPSNIAFARGDGTIFMPDNVDGTLSLARIPGR